MSWASTLEKIRFMFQSRHVVQPLGNEAEASDFGRRFGWFVERDGACIGELDYLRWDAAAQFWHEYRTTWHDPADAIEGSDVGSWSSLVLRNRRFTGAVSHSFVVSPTSDARVIAIRGAWVDDAALRSLQAPPPGVRPHK